MFELSVISLWTCVVVGAVLVKSATCNSLDASNAVLSYAAAVRVARCQSRCFALFASEDADVGQDGAFLIPPVCTAQECVECLEGCSIKDGASCATNCTEGQRWCVDSCLFLRSMPNVTRQSTVTSLWSSSPEVFCYDLKSGDDVYGVVLKWTLGGAAPRAPAASFVLQMRSDPRRGWITLLQRYQGLIPVTNLNATQRYQFRLSAVLQDGVLQRPKTSARFH